MPTGEAVFSGSEGRSNTLKPFLSAPSNLPAGTRTITGTSGTAERTQQRCEWKLVDTAGEAQYFGG